MNELDIAPRFGGILKGIANSAATLAGCITPSVTGYFTNNEVRVYLVMISYILSSEAFS